jgi:hypothetical protein
LQHSTDAMLLPAVFPFHPGIEFAETTLAAELGMRICF